MDMSFARKNRRAVAARTPDLQALLSHAAARQALTPTARAQWRLTANVALGDPRIALFCADLAGSLATGSSFATIAAVPVNRGQ